MGTTTDDEISEWVVPTLWKIDGVWRDLRLVLSPSTTSSLPAAVLCRVQARSQSVDILRGCQAAAQVRVVVYSCVDMGNGEWAESRPGTGTPRVTKEGQAETLTKSGLLLSTSEQCSRSLEPRTDCADVVDGMYRCQWNKKLNSVRRMLRLRIFGWLGWLRRVYQSDVGNYQYPPNVGVHGCICLVIDLFEPLHGIGEL